VNILVCLRDWCSWHWLKFQFSMHIN